MTLAAARPDEHEEASAVRVVMRWTLLALVMALAGACSDNREDVTLAEWATATCDALDTLARLPSLASLAELAELERVADAIDETVAEIDAMSPPESARSYQRELLRLYRGVSRAQRDFIEAAAGGSAALDAATIEYRTELERLFGEVDTEALTADTQEALRLAGCDG